MTEARTPLYAAHLSLNAKMAPFGGFIMPISYAGIIAEHGAVRNAAGLFDLSHMGQFTVTGPDAGLWLDGLTANAVSSMRPYQARYNIFTNELGGARDDTIIYRLPERWLVVVNAVNTSKIWQWLHAQRRPGIELYDRTPEHALIAVQGPRSRELLQPLCAVDLTAIRSYWAAEGSVTGIAAEIARTGYTGEDGFELFVAARDALLLWERLMAAGARFKLQPAGLGARDVLRLEAGMPLYGHELAEDITPLQAGLDWVVNFAKGEFIGRDALWAQKQHGGYDRIAGIIMESKAPARAGYPVMRGGRPVGTIQSGSPAPSLGGKNIATALLKEPASHAGTHLEVDIRGQLHACTVVPQPFYKRSKAGLG